MKKYKITLLVAAAIMLATPIGSNLALAGPGEIIDDNSTTVDKDDNSNEITPPPTSEQSPLIQSKKMVIKSVSCDQTSITPGKPFTLTFRVKNMTSSTLERVALNIGIATNHEHKQPFIPVGTTNEIYIGDVAANKEKTISITLVSNSSLANGTYSFNTNLLFNSPGKQQEAITQVSGITVSKPTAITIKDVSLSLETGTNIIGSIYNDSKEAIKDVTVQATIDGEIYETKIPSIDAEDEMDFQIWLPDDSNDREASILAFYNNALDEEVSTSTNFTVFGNNTESNEGDFVPPEPQKKTLWQKFKSLFTSGE